MSAPQVTFTGPIQHLGSDRAGARPGDGTVRSLLPHEFFVNAKDGVLCYLADTGAMQVAYFLTAAGMASWFAGLPIVEPTSTPGAPWNNTGTLSFAGFGPST